MEHNHDRFLKLLFDPNLLVTRSEPKLKYTHPKVTYKAPFKPSKYSKTQKIGGKWKNKKNDLKIINYLCFNFS